MFQDWIKKWDEAKEDGDGDRQLLAAGEIVETLRKSPLSIVFRPEQGGPVLPVGLAMIHVRGGQIGLLQYLRVELDSKTQFANVEAALPFDDTEDELAVGDVMEEPGHETRRSAARYAEALAEVGVRVIRVPLQPR